MRIKKKCQICNKEYEVIPYRQYRTKYCSAKCRHKARIGRPYSVETCRKISEAHKGKKHWWSSPKKRVNIKCQWCGKEFETIYCLRDKKKFCSKDCLAKWQSKNRRGENSPKWRRKKVNCIYCSKEFVAKGDRIDKGLSKFCSLRCWGIYSRIHMKKKDTDIELLVQAMLEKEKIQFEKQKPIGRIAVVDFLIKGKFIVQADGDYWHTLEHMKKKDERQNKLLIEKGYIISRFWGSDIKNNPEKCIKEIKDKCQTLN